MACVALALPQCGKSVEPQCGNSVECRCGAPAAWRGRCKRCYWADRDDRRKFGGERLATLERDGRRCRGCEAVRDLVVHHRPVGLVTVCRRCHGRLHHLPAMTIWMPAGLVELWVEQHPTVPFQFSLVFVQGLSVGDAGSRGRAGGGLAAVCHF